jgi:hypothetical protein
MGHKSVEMVAGYIREPTSGQNQVSMVLVLNNLVARRLGRRLPDVEALTD